MCRTPGYPFKPGELIGRVGGGSHDASITYYHKAGEQFGICAIVRILLSDHKLVGPEVGLEGWIAKRTGKLEHEVEATAPRDFILRAESYLKRMKITEVLLSLLDNDDEAYRIDENVGKDLDNLQEVIEKTMFKVVNAEHQPLRVLLEAYGRTADFEVQLQLRFNEVHPVGDPCILLHIWALQEALWKKQDESEFEYEDRINNLLLDENRVRQLEEDGRSKIQPLMRSYEEVLKGQFDVVESSTELKIDMSRILV